MPDFQFQVPEELGVPRKDGQRLEEWFTYDLQTKNKICVQGGRGRRWFAPLANHVYSELARAGRTTFKLDLKGRWDNAGGIMWGFFNCYRPFGHSFQVTRVASLEDLHGVLHEEAGYASLSEFGPPEFMFLVIQIERLWEKNTSGLTEKEKSFFNSLHSLRCLRTILILDSFPVSLNRWIRFPYTKGLDAKDIRGPFLIGNEAPLSNTVNTKAPSQPSLGARITSFFR